MIIKERAKFFGEQLFFSYLKRNLAPNAARDKGTNVQNVFIRYTKHLMSKN